MQYTGISDGVKVVLDIASLDAYKASLRKLKGKRVAITLCAESRPNSKPQQRYFRGVVVKMISEHTGDDVKSTYAHLQGQFFLYYDKNNKPYVRSTEIGEWTTVEWEEKMQEIRVWAFNFLGINIPLPNEIEGF